MPHNAKSRQDHPTVGVTRKVRMAVSTVLDSQAKTEAAPKEYLENAAGPLTSTGGDLFGKKFLVSSSHALMA